MNVDEFARYMNRSPQVARRWLRRGLPGTRRNGREWVIDDPLAAAAAWDESADDSKSPASVLLKPRPKAVVAPGPALAVSPEIAAEISAQICRYLAWLRDTAKACSEFEHIDHLQLDAIFELYVAANAPETLAQWRDGAIVPERDI